MPEARRRSRQAACAGPTTCARERRRIRLLLPHVNIEEAAALAERIRAAVSSLNIRHEDSTVAPHVTVSLGVSGTVPAPDGGYTRLIEAADRALYRAKTGGRNRVERD